MTFDLGVTNDIANGKWNQPSRTASRYRKYALSSLLKSPFTFLSRYCPRCVCTRLNRFFLHLVGRRFALYLEQTCGSGQEQVRTLGSSGAHTAQFGQKLTCQKSVYRAMATGDTRVIDLLVRGAMHTQHLPLGTNYYLQCRITQCLNLECCIFVSSKWVSFHCFLSVCSRI